MGTDSRRFAGKAARQWQAFVQLVSNQRHHPGKGWRLRHTRFDGGRDGEGYLLFSDPNNNLIYRMTPDGDVQLYMTKSGYAGENIGEYRQPGSNGLTLDEQGRLTICQHGNRRVVRIEKNGLTTVLADRYEGK